mmetsp:Transcript_34640/g.99850  ORF Transcript_34640/g.99850 Transcript_34640/m.99850 type:complete len:314 (-) Transcript_34640:32-973(-)
MLDATMRGGLDDVAAAARSRPDLDADAGQVPAAICFRDLAKDAWQAAVELCLAVPAATGCVPGHPVALRANHMLQVRLHVPATVGVMAVMDVELLLGAVVHGVDDEHALVAATVPRRHIEELVVLRRIAAIDLLCACARRARHHQVAPHDAVAAVHANGVEETICRGRVLGAVGFFVVLPATGHVLVEVTVLPVVAVVAPCGVRPQVVVVTVVVMLCLDLLQGSLVLRDPALRRVEDVHILLVDLGVRKFAAPHLQRAQRAIARRLALVIAGQQRHVRRCSHDRWARRGPEERCGGRADHRESLGGQTVRPAD